MILQAEIRFYGETNRRIFSWIKADNDLQALRIHIEYENFHFELQL